MHGKKLPGMTIMRSWIDTEPEDEIPGSPFLHGMLHYGMGRRVRNTVCKDS